MKRRGLVAALALCAAACSKKGPEQEGRRLGIGAVVAPGRASDVRLTPDGATALYLLDGKKPHLDGIPPQMVLGRLRAVRLDGGGDRELGEGVTNLPGGFVLSRDSAWVAFLSGYNPASQTGKLTLAGLGETGRESSEVAEGVGYVAFSPDSRWLAFLAGGVLRAGPVGEGPYVEVAGEVALADFAPSSGYLVARRKSSAGGALLMVEAGRWQGPRKLADGVGDFTISADSSRVAIGVRSPRVPAAYDLFVASAPRFAPVRVADSVGAFAFSGDSGLLARIQDQPPGPDQLGNLYVGPADGTSARKLAAGAHEFAFAPDSRAIAYLASYRVQANAGKLGVAVLPDGAPKDLGDLVPNFGWSPDGKSLAFVQRFLRPIFSVDLMLHRVGEPSAVKVQQGVYGYGFSADGKRLLYRTACVRDGRACDLHARELDVPLGVNDAGVLEVKGKKVAGGVYGYFKSAENGERVLVTFARIDSPLYDVGVVNLGTGQYRTLEERTLLPPLFANGEGTRVVYAVASRARPGVYVAEQVP